MRYLTGRTWCEWNIGNRINRLGNGLRFGGHLRVQEHFSCLWLPNLFLLIIRYSSPSFKRKLECKRIFFHREPVLSQRWYRFESSTPHSLRNVVWPAVNDVSSSFVPLRCFVSFLCYDQNIPVWAKKGALRTELAYKTDGISWVSISFLTIFFLWNSFYCCWIPCCKGVVVPIAKGGIMDTGYGSDNCCGLV